MSVTARGAMRRNAGFSLIELMIAMVVTLLVSGAVFGLMTAGQSAFRREPQLSDRQQSIRQAMAAIEEDAMRAGLNLPPFVQAFTDNLDGVGPLGVMAANQNSDNLEMLIGDATCDISSVCQFGPTSAGAPALFSVPSVSTCMQANLPGLLAFFDGTGRYVVQSTRLSAAPPAMGCALGDPGPHPNQLTLTAGRHPGSPAYLPAGVFTAAGVASVQLVRYEIAPCGDLLPDGTLMPCLWRSATGRFDLAGNNLGPAPGNPVGNGLWQIVARGVDDMQVQYRNGNNLAGAWAGRPGVVCDQGSATCSSPANNPAAFNSIVRQVQVTLSARVAATDLPGEMRPVPAAPQSVRGQLTGVFAPRAAMAALTKASPNPMWQ